MEDDWIPERTSAGLAIGHETSLMSVRTGTAVASSMGRTPAGLLGALIAGLEANTRSRAIQLITCCYQQKAQIYSRSQTPLILVLRR